MTPAPVPRSFIDLPLARAEAEVTPGQRRAVIVAIAALHGLGGWAALQVPAVRSALQQAAPMFVDLIAPPAPPVPEPPPPPPPPPKPILKPPPPAPLITAAPSPAPAVFVAPPPPEAPAPPPVPIVVEVPPAPPAPPPPPKEIPASAIEYLVPPAPEYPRLSRRLNESGLVIVRVYVDEAGVPRSVQVARSSGFVRLDEAAIAGAQKARFKPYTENGRPTAGWARIPFPFELEK